MRHPTSAMRGFIDRVFSVGRLPEDDADARLRKGGLLLSAWAITGLATIWVLLYLVMGRPLSAAIPFSYQLATLVSIAWVARRGWTDRFPTSQIILVLALPALLMWSLGGFVSGSAVIIWSLLAPMGALIFADLHRAGLSFGAFIALVILSGLFDPWLVANVEPVSTTTMRTFFVLNIVAVSCVAFGAFIYFVRQRQLAQAALSAANAALDEERRRSDELLRNILPDAVSERLKDGQVVADRYEAVTVLFADIVGFTPLATTLPTEEVVDLLDRVYGGLDELAAQHGMVRIKTMGDAYMAAAGVPDAVPARDGALAAAAMALAMLARVEAMVPDVKVRIGLHTGPAIAGVIGHRSFAYDIWGDTVNIASRMESHGLPGRIQVSAATYALIGDHYEGTPRGSIAVKGLGAMETYLIDPRHPAAALRS